MTLGNDPLAALWMPFTANRAFKAHPRQLVAAKDMHYESADGRPKEEVPEHPLERIYC